MEIYANEEMTRAIMVEDGSIIKAYGLTNVLCCEPFGEDGLINTEELGLTEEEDFEWDEISPDVLADEAIELIESNLASWSPESQKKFHNNEGYRDCVISDTLYAIDEINDENRDSIYRILAKEYELPVKKDIKYIKDKYDLNTKQLAERFDIPYRTVQNWVYGVRECPAYIIGMMEECLDNEDRTIISVYERGDHELCCRGTIKQVRAYLGDEYKDCKDIFDLEEVARAIEDYKDFE